MIADLADLEAVLGAEALATLVSVAGGLDLYIPRRAPMDGPLAELPLPAQEALAAWAGGGRLYVPKCDGAARAQRDLAILADYDAGVSVKALALKYRLTERRIYGILGRPAPDIPCQGRLF